MRTSAHLVFRGGLLEAFTELDSISSLRSVVSLDGDVGPVVSATWSGIVIESWQVNSD